MTEIATTNDLDVLMFDLNNLDKKMIFRGHEECPSCLEFSPNSELLASGSDDNTVRIWRLPDELIDGNIDETPEFVLKDHASGITCIAFTSDSAVIASGSFDGTVIFWSTETGERLNALSTESEDRSIYECEFSRTSSYDPLSGNTEGVFVHSDKNFGVCVMVGHRFSTMILNISNGVQFMDVLTLSSDVSYNCRTNDISGTIAFAGWKRDEDNEYTSHGVIYSLTTKESIPLDSMGFDISELTISPDSSSLLVSHNDGHIDLIRLDNQERLLTFGLSYESPITCAVFSPDSSLIVSVNEDSFMRIWNSTTGEEINTMKTKYGCCVAFRPQRVILM
jgi:WD40 repeat protein